MSTPDATSCKSGSACHPAISLLQREFNNLTLHCEFVLTDAATGHKLTAI